MTTEVCERHRKRIYPTGEAAIHAALASSRAFGKSFRVYDCRSEADVFKGYHITSQNERVNDGV